MDNERIAIVFKCFGFMVQSTVKGFKRGKEKSVGLVGSVSSDPLSGDITSGAVINYGLCKVTRS